MDGRPNYYILLELDPAVEDADTISKKIQAKRQEWSRQQSMGNPAAAGQAKANLAMIADVQRVLGDPETRRNEAGEALTRKKEERRKALAELDQMIALLLLAGETCTTNDVEQIKKTLSKHLPDKEIADRLRAKGLSVEKAGAAKPKSPSAAKPRLDPARMDQLRPNLTLVGAKTLYDFLGMNEQSSTRSLWEHADQRNKELLRVGKNDPATNTAKALCGQCLAIFDSDENRKKYDNSLAIEAMEGLRPRIELIGKSGSFLLVEHQDALVQQARELGVDAADARAFMEDLAASRKWGLQKAKKLPSEELRQCGNCLALAKSGASHCGHCGFGLTIECPHCSKVVPTEHPACTACGFHIGDWATIKRDLESASNLIADFQIDDAASRLRALLARWPGWKAIQSQLNSAEGLIKKRDRERAELLSLVRQSKLFEAQGASERYQRAWPKDTIGPQSAKISEGIARARKTFEAGEQRRLKGESEEAIALYRGALTICTDYEAARKAMALVPPTPPKNLAVAAQGRGFQLRWEAGGKTVDDYVVVRKSRGTPSHHDDGDYKQATRDLVATDANVQEGVPWHYAVYSRRDGVFSAGAARSGPHLRVAPVRDLLASAGDSQIKLTWKLPAAAVGVEVWRHQGSAPNRPGHGIRRTASRETLHDSGLVNETTFGYLVLPLFEDPQRPGATLQGPGATCVATPTIPPSPVVDLKLERQQGGVRLNWTSPGAGEEVLIRQLPSAPEYPVGAILTQEQANALGTAVVAATKTSAQVRLPNVAEAWFLPLTVKTTIAVIGRPVSIVLVDGPTDVVGDHNGRDIHLTWNWPEGATQMTVCHSYRRYPATPNDGDAIRQDVTLEQYRRQGIFTMRKVERRPHYFSLFVVTAGGRLYSDPVSQLVQVGDPREVRYRIVSPPAGFLSRLSGRERQLQLEMSGSGHLPETVLVAKPRVVPTGPDDGEKIMYLPEMELNGTYRRPIPSAVANSGNIAKLFFTNSRHVDEIRLVTQSPNKLKL